MISENDAIIKEELHTEHECSDGAANDDIEFEVEPWSDDKNEDEDVSKGESKEVIGAIRMISRNKMYRKTKKLIEMVKNCPMLYDHTVGDSNNLLRKNRIWEEISEAIEEASVDTTKKKWKNLRDSYGKYLRSVAESKNGVKVYNGYRKWPWVHEMAFLRPHIDIKFTQPTVVPEQKFEIEIKPKIKSKPLVRKTKYDNLDLIFLGYSRMLKKMPKRLQSKVNSKIARVIQHAVSLNEFDMSSHSKVFKRPYYSNYLKIKVEDEAANDNMTDPLSIAPDSINF